MDRRHFTQGLIATGLSAPLSGLAAPALANIREDHGRPELGPARLQLRIAAQLVLLEWFLITTSVATWGIDLRHPVPRIDENRLSARKLPLLGQMFRPTLRQQFSGAVLLGSLVLLGPILVLALGRSRLSRRPREVVLLNGKTSYRPRQAPVPVNAKLPAIGDLRRHRTVGSAYRKGDSLLILIRPTILDRDFPGG